KASSIISSVSGKFTGSVLSDAIVPWKVKNGKTSSTPSETHVDQPPPPPFNDDEHHHPHHHHNNNNHENEVDDDDDDDDNDNDVNTGSEAATTDNEMNEK
ncbi:hypothetical protein A2U01_0072486, partial [Trifolium medium]|nr:hypothetical protein [Trifolium medium]